jgi:hypothetical protein
MICLSFRQKKIAFKHCLTPKNLVTASFKTKKSHLSIIYYQEIYEILWILTGYHIKSENSLIQAHLSQIKKSLSLLLNNTFSRLTLFVSYLKIWDPKLYLIVSFVIKVSSLNNLDQHWSTYSVTVADIFACKLRQCTRALPEWTVRII